MSDPCDLVGLGVLVTRPAAQAKTLCALIRSANGRPLCFPALEILPVKDPEEALTLLRQSWDLLIFVSRNAVDQAIALGLDGSWPAAHTLAAVGRATAEALDAAGRAPDLVPSSRFDSEAMLAMSELSDMTGQRVLICRGDGGRALLGNELGRRGAAVHYAEVYRRGRPAVQSGHLLRRWRSDVQVVTVTSDGILRNLMQLLGDRGRATLLDTPLVVISERTADTARRLGFQRVRVAQRAEDASIVQAICDLASTDS